MIARIWRGITPADQADGYLAFLRENALQRYAEIPGNRGVHVLRRDQGEHTEIMIVSLWDSLDAVRAFAGERAEASVYYPEEDRFLLEMEPLVRLYDVVDRVEDPAQD